MNSGYENLTGLLMKETNDKRLKPDFQKENYKKDSKSIKNYGQLSLNKIKY